MGPLRLIFLFYGALCIISCGHSPGYDYAIKDFRIELQPYLRSIVETGIADLYPSSASLDTLITDQELEMMSHSEHPVLRGEAIRIMLNRPSLDQYEIIMLHLGDTAFIQVDMGEWGIQPERVSDFMLSRGKWPTEKAKFKTMVKVVTQHNVLHSAYNILYSIPVEERFYESIKEMCKRQRQFEETESALYALARYKKSGDILFIKKILLEHCYELSDQSFRLMSDFPDKSYLEILQLYANRYLFRRKSLYNPYNYESSEYFTTLVSYKDETSFAILQQLLSKKPQQYSFPDTALLKEHIGTALWDNKANIYTPLLPLVRYYFHGPEFILEPIEPHEDTTKPEIRWDN